MTAAFNIRLVPKDATGTPDTSNLTDHDDLSVVLAAACDGLQDVNAARFEVDGVRLGEMDLWYDLFVVIEQVPRLLQAIEDGELDSGTLDFSSQGKERVLRLSPAENGIIQVRSENYQGITVCSAVTTIDALREDLLRLGQTFVDLCSQHVPAIAAHSKFQAFAKAFSPFIGPGASTTT